MKQQIQSENALQFKVKISEISILDIANSLIDSWKRLVIALALGAILGFSGWFFLGDFQAEIVLLNKGGTDLVSWRSLQKALPNLADQIIDEGKVPEGKNSLYRIISTSDWWQKNVQITYGMSKADVRDLVSTAGLESAGSSIVALTLYAHGSTRQDALENARSLKDFLLQGGAFLALQSLFNEQEGLLIRADADIAKKITDNQIELGYLRERLKSLEALAKRFPNEQKVVSQVVDLKDSNAKYLPLSTQIIAVNTDINGIKESLERLRDNQLQMAVLRMWIIEASPLMSSTFDGLSLTRQLLDKEVGLRTTIDPADLKSVAFLDNLRSALLVIDARYKKGFEINTAPTVRKKGMIKATAGGLAAAFCLMLFVVLRRSICLRAKGDDEE